MRELPKTKSRRVWGSILRDWKPSEDYKQVSDPIRFWKGLRFFSLCPFPALSGSGWLVEGSSPFTRQPLQRSPGTDVMLSGWEQPRQNRHANSPFSTSFLVWLHCFCQQSPISFKYAVSFNSSGWLPLEGETVDKFIHTTLPETKPVILGWVDCQRPCHQPQHKLSTWITQ